MRLLFGPGQRHDATRSHELIAGLKPGAVIADKGCDADHLHQAIRDAGAEPVIPAKSNRAKRRPHDKTLYKEASVWPGPRRWCVDVCQAAAVRLWSVPMFQGSSSATRLTG